MEITVYVDVLFLINFLINLILLKLTSLLAKIPASTLRLSLSATIGALYAVCMFFPSVKFLYIFPCKMILSLLMLKIMSPKSKIVKLLKITAIFYLISFTFAGVLLSLIYIGKISTTSSPVMQNGIFYFDISLKKLIIASIVSYIVICISQSVFKRNKTMGIKNLKIFLSGRECEMPALSDSGNLLKDPLSHNPVIIAEQKFLAKLFPDGIPDIDDISDSKLRLRVIPYSSLGKTNGILTGFIPDEVHIDGKKTVSVVIALSPDSLSKKDEYNALFNPNILA